MNILEKIKPITEAKKKTKNPLEEIKRQLPEPDFLAIVYPAVILLRKEYDETTDANEKNKIAEKISKFKVQQKHYIVIAIDESLKVAERLKLDLCTYNNSVYTFNQTHWERIEEQDLKKFLGECAKIMKVPFFDASYFDFRDKLLKQFFSEAYLPKPEPDCNKVLINFLNGTLEISKTKTLFREHKASDFITYALSYNYDPTATYPKFQKFLNDVISLEKQTVLAEYLGYIFMKHQSGLKLEKVLLCYGTGANGKSVFFDVVSALLGDENVSNYSLQSLTNDNGYFRAKIADKLLNYSSEINNSIEASIFKQLASGEPIEARLPYGEPFTMKQYAKMIFNTNGFLIGEQTNAFFRRFLIIHFEKTISEKDQDSELSKKIIENELAGVLNWALKGLERILQNKEFTYSDEMAKTLNDYRVQSDPVQSFLLDEGITPGTKEEPLKDLYKVFKYSAEESGNRIISLKTFADRLRMVGFEIKRKSAGNVVYISEM